MSKKYFFIQKTGELYPKWEEKLLGEVAEVIRGNGLSKSSLSIEGTRECILYGELFTKYTTVINNVVSRTNEVSSVSSKIGDILMPTSDVTPDGLAKASVIFKENVLLGSDMNIVRVNVDVNPLFMGYQINHKKEEIIKRVSGSSVKHIYARNLLDIPYVLPSLPEQKKIAEFFSALDERIALTADKVKLLKEQKAGFLQRVLAKEIVFTDDNDDRYPEWEQKKLRDVLNLHSGKDQKGFEDPDGQYPILATGGEIGRTNTPLCSEESVLIGRKGTIDKPKYINTPFRTVDTLFYTTMKDGISAKFIYVVVQSVKWKKLSEASGVPSLNSSIILNVDCPVPSLPEQEKIAEFFSALDEQIELTENKLTLLKEQKKGYLQGIFG